MCYLLFWEELVFLLGAARCGAVVAAEWVHSQVRMHFSRGNLVTARDFFKGRLRTLETPHIGFEVVFRRSWSLGALGSGSLRFLVVQVPILYPQP